MPVSAKDLRSKGVDLQKYGVSTSSQDTAVFRSFLLLLQKYGSPLEWPWYPDSVSTNDPEEIIIGSILTQNITWKNVETALLNLKQYFKTDTLRLHPIWELYKEDKTKLQDLIRPAGFFNAKADYLFAIAEKLFEIFKTWDINKIANQIRKHGEMFLKDKGFKELQTFRKSILSTKGIGLETADTILLYAFGLPSFVVDKYTYRFVRDSEPLREDFLRQSSLEDYPRWNARTYSLLQAYFVNNIPLNVRLFQDYHALIVFWGKRIRTH